MAVFSEVYDEDKDKVFVIRGTIEVRVPRHFYNQLKRKYSDEEIVSMQEPKILRHHHTKRELVYVTKESGLPLIGHTASASSTAARTSSRSARCPAVTLTASSAASTRA